MTAVDETAESNGKNPLEIKLKRLAAANGQLTSILKYMVMELDILEPYRQKYNDLLFKFHKMAAERKNTSKEKTDTEPNAEIEEMPEHSIGETASHEKAQQTVEELRKQIEMERELHAQQMKEYYEQNQIQNDKIQKQMTNKMHELMHAMHEYQEEAIRATQMARKMVGENHYIRQKVDARNWEIVKWTRKQSFCLAKIDELKASIEDYKRCEAKYEMEIQHLKQAMVNQFQKYQFAMSNKAMASARMGKHKCCSTLNAIDNSVIARKRLRLSETPSLPNQ